MTSFGSQTPNAINVLKAVGITSTAGLGGLMLSCTFYAIPTLLLAPAAVAVPQWNNMFERGKAFNPPVVVLISSIFSYLSYRSYHHHTPISISNNISASSTPSAAWIQYAAAAVLVPAVVPFTLVVLNPVNNQLIKAATVEIGQERTMELLRRWGVLNAWRSVFLFVAAGLGAWASLTEIC